MIYYDTKKTEKNIMRETALKAYETYKKITQKTFTQVTTTQLNVLYNISCRAKRDLEYASALAEIVTDSGELIVDSIDKYFTGYNARHGLEIRDNLIEFTDPSFAEGSYFILTTYKQRGDGSFEEHAPTEFKAGDIAHVRATLYNHAKDEEMVAQRLYMTSLNDDLVSTEKKVTNAHTIEFDLTISRPGFVKFKVIAQDENGNTILGSETAYGGVLFSFEEIRPSHTPPHDLLDFWNEEIDRLMKVNPCDTIPDGYEGRVVWEFDMPKKNFYSITKFTSEYFNTLREYKIYCPDEAYLETHDIYELNLKAPGPCHASTYLSIPKTLGKRVPMKITYDGYSAYAPSPVVNDNAICLHCSHHGYELPKPAEGYYFVLSRGILKYYGRANGETNSDYDDIHDCYMTYLHLRNLQALRYITDPALSGDIPYLHDVWNGEVEFSGGSMGGYQALCISALALLLKKKTNDFKITSTEANIPGFANLAGRGNDRVPTYLTRYADGMDYFDPATLAHLIENPVRIPRAGLGDETCPASGIIATFNAIREGVPKEICFLQNSNHGYIPEEPVQRWYKYKYNTKG